MAIQIGESVRAARQAAGMTQVAAAELAGLQQASVAQIESGRYLPSLPVLWRLADAYGCPLDTLVGRSAAEKALKTGRKKNREKSAE